MSKKTSKILCVDDDDFIRQMITDYLEKEDYEVLQAGDGEGVKDIFAVHKDIDLVLLDLILPDTDGIELIQYIKKLQDVPIIMISSKAEDVDRIIGIETGADDYMAKPFLPRELKARMNAILRRFEKTTSKAMPHDNKAKVKFDCWVLDPSQYQVFDKDNNPVGLTTSEFIILNHLVQFANKTISREKLFEITRHVDVNTYDRAIDIQITRIRKKLGDSAKNSKYIQTIRGVGYLFCCPVEKIIE